MMKMTNEEFQLELDALYRKFFGDAMADPRPKSQTIIKTTTTVTKSTLVSVEKDADAAFDRIFGELF